MGAADAMVDWMNRTDEHFAEIHADIAELRQEMNAKFADTREEMRVGFARLEAKMETRFAAVDARFAAVDAKFAALEAKLDSRFADFMKWTIGFWVASLITYVGAIVGLANVLK